MAKIVDTARKLLISPKLKRHIDLNMDYGQTPDRPVLCREDGQMASQLLSLVSSVNIPACVHDGDPKEVLQDIAKAKQANCGIGAHIAYPDPANKGYEVMDISSEDLTAWVYVQVGAFRALCMANGIDVEHVRPHGALYGQFLTNFDTARVVAETLYKINPWTILIGPAGPILNMVQEKVGIRIAPEIYLGKQYNASGMPIAEQFNRNMHSQAVVDQARQLVMDSSLVSQDGHPVKVNFRTLHLSLKLENPANIADKINNFLGHPVPLSLAAVGESGWV